MVVAEVGVVGTPFLVVRFDMMGKGSFGAGQVSSVVVEGEGREKVIQFVGPVDENGCKPSSRM